MCLSDTAEYWQDVKRKSMYFGGNEFRHAKGVECGHNHNIMDTEYIDDVECNACKRIIQEGKAIGMIEGKAPETYYMSNKEKKDYNRQKIFNEQHGKCPCGSIWVIRQNTKDKKKFLGCLQYPKCKNTKSITDNGNKTNG